jgi:hypothetical protein
MTAAANAIVFKNAVVTIDGVEYANQVNKARFVPTQETQTYKTLVPDGAQQDVDSATWTLELAGLQINHANGLAKALRDAAAIGDLIDVTIQPKVGSGQPTMTGTITPLKVPFGGEQGKFLEFDMTFPVTGEPTDGVSA